MRNARKERQLEAMLRDVAHDIESRGRLPAILVGDYNIQIAESAYLQQQFRYGHWQYAIPCIINVFPDEIHSTGSGHVKVGDLSKSSRKRLVD